MKKIYTLAVALLVGIAASYAQYYYIPKSGQNPGGLNKDGEYPVGGGLDASWTTLVTGPATGGSWTDVTIPFSFTFNNSQFTSAKVSNYGVVTFTASPSGTPIGNNAAIPHSSIPDNSILCWGLTVGSGDYIVTKAFGTAPNRQFWIQFNSCSEPGISGGYLYMSVVLEETTNNVYIVDQRASGNTTSLTVGLQLNSTTAVSVDGSPNYTAKATLDASPSDNSYYSFYQGVQPKNDVTVNKVILDKNLSAKKSPFDIACQVFNSGSDPITSVKFAYQIDQNPEVVTVVSGLNIAKFASGNIISTTKWAQATPSVNNVTVTIKEVNGASDPNPLDNMSSKQVNVWDDCAPRKTLFEGFTSSTCGPCVLGNVALAKVLDARPGMFTVVKYQMAFPGTGDPYVTDEGVTRAGFYKNTPMNPGIPRGFIDGKWDANTQGITTDLIDSFNSKACFISMNPTQTRTNNKFDFTVNYTPLKTMSTSDQYKMFFAIVERVTSNNVATNGETEFHWVMKKMLPDANGTALTMPAKNTQGTQNFTWTVPGSYRLPADGTAANRIKLTTENSVEELWDLVGVAWIQDITTGEVLQSEWTLPVGATLGTNEIIMGDAVMSIFPNPASKSFTVKLDKEINNAKVEIFNLTGQMVYTSEMGKSLEKEIDCNHLNNGIYMVNISNGQSSSTQKLIINR